MKTNWKMPRLGATMKLSAFALLLAACGQPAAEKKKEAAQEPIKVGVILPMTGRLAPMGEVERNAMMLAAQDANASGKRIELLFEDGKGTPKDAAAAANKLLDIDGADLLIASTTGASMAAQPITAAKKRNLIAYCMDADIAASSEYTTRYYIGIAEEAAAITRHFADEPTKHKVAILHAKVSALENVVNNTYIPALEASGHAIVYRESYEVTETDFRSLILKLRSSGADQLILVGYGFEYPNIFKEIESNALLGKIQIVGGWGFLYTPLSKEQLEGVLVSGPEYVFKNQDLANAFQAKYEKAYGAKPNFDAAFAYTVIRALAEGMTKADVALPLKKKLAGQPEQLGVVGTYTISASGNMIVKTALGVYRNGVLAPLEASGQ